MKVHYSRRFPKHNFAEKCVNWTSLALEFSLDKSPFRHIHKIPDNYKGTHCWDTCTYTLRETEKAREREREEEESERYILIDWYWLFFWNEIHWWLAIRWTKLIEFSSKFRIQVNHAQRQARTRAYASHFVVTIVLDFIQASSLSASFVCTYV